MENENTVKSKCKYCGKTVRVALFRDKPDWIHDETGNWGCKTRTDGHWRYADSDDPKVVDPEPASADSLGSLVVKYYNKKFIENLKAQTPLTKMYPGQIIPVDDVGDYQQLQGPPDSIDPVGVPGKAAYSYTYSYSPKTGMVPVTPDPPKKAFPKAVESTNGRKFRHEE